MQIGQAVGAAAALSARRGVQPRNLSPKRVQIALVESGIPVGWEEFDDVTYTHGWWEDIVLVTAWDYLNGYSNGDFGPDDIITRAQTAVLLSKAFHLQGTIPAVPTFQDVSMQHFAFEAIELLASKGITSGCEPSVPNFCPSDPTLRSHLAIFLARAMELDVDPYDGNTGYTDVGTGSEIAKHIEALENEGVSLPCNSTGTRFCPGASVTRKEAARWIRIVVEQFFLGP
jgi:hypothetical protein